VHRGDADDDEDRERQQLGERENLHASRAPPDAPHVDRGQRGEHEQDEQSAPHPAAHPRQPPGDRGCQRGRDRGARREVREGQQHAGHV